MEKLILERFLALPNISVAAMASEAGICHLMQCGLLLWKLWKTLALAAFSNAIFMHRVLFSSIRVLFSCVKFLENNNIHLQELILFTVKSSWLIMIHKYTWKYLERLKQTCFAWNLYSCPLLCKHQQRFAVNIWEDVTVNWLFGNSLFPNHFIGTAIRDCGENLFPG